MSSQYGEHDHILRYFGEKPGKFLDVGAFDGVSFSNTRPLAEAGWSGVCVEPSPQAFCWLMHHYAGNPRVELVNAAVTDIEQGLRRFHANTRGDQTFAADAMSTFDPAHRQKFERGNDQPYREIWIASISWAKLWMVAGRVDFINIDVEGMNVALLQALPFAQFKPRMICVEMDPESEVPWMAKHLAADAGLTQQERVGGNLLAWRKK